MEKTYCLTSIKEAETLPFAVSLTGITYPDPSYKIYREKSLICVIEYVEEGEGTIFVDDVKYDIKKGDAYILPLGHRHLYYSSPDKPWKKIWMNISGSICNPLFNCYGISGIYHFPNSDIGQLINNFLDLCSQKSDMKEINQEGAVYFLKIVQSLASKQNAHYSVANVAKSFIDNNICRRITAEQTAKQISISVSQLGRLFKSEYGVTVYSYILSGKLENAKNLLLNTMLPIYQISDMLGFTDEHYFSNVFKKKYNISPGKYRSAKKNGQI